MTRIRYQKSNDGTLVSNQSFVTTEGEVTVLISPDFHVSIVGDAGRTLTTAHAVNSLKAKKIAKSMLVELGVEFFGETRVRKTEEVPTIENSEVA